MVFVGFISVGHARDRAGKNQRDFFLFDKADETIPATLLENPVFYDAGIATATNGAVWFAWLEFHPGSGDQIWLGLRSADGKWIQKRKITGVDGDFANPTPTVDSHGQLRLSYEAAHGSNWNVIVEQQSSKSVHETETLFLRFQGINHSVVATPDGSLALVYQKESAGRFTVASYRLDLEQESNPANFLNEISAPGNSWHPSVAITPDNQILTICDAYDGRSYNVVLQEKNSRIQPISATASFEANAQIACGKDGKIWISWEEDGENWGQRYIVREPGIKTSTRMADNLGPLHRFRRLHLAQLDDKNRTLTEIEIPQPSFDLARHRTNAPPGLKNFGAFYEGAQLAVDGQNRLWIVYRHYFATWIGISYETHKQQDSRIYARCLLPDGWSKLYSFSEGQGDALQRISISPKADGINLAWTTGRTDRRDPKTVHRGVALATISLGDVKAQIPAKTKIISLPAENIATSPAPRVRPSAEVGGKHYELFYGDLHRHTDISLCFSPADGSIDDAYRYAIDAAPLDFLGITDHTHDLAMGDPLSLIWWRSRKEVNRHTLGTTFFPFYSYERSRRDTDHNVISLRDDMMRPHTYPLPQFWTELDTNTFTIAHQPFNPVLWNHKDNVHRPLVEIYQGFRNDARESDAREGLMRGHEFGIIASSDHLSTDASFACVWSDKISREGIFRSMQARRTFGATAKIVLKVTCGEHWMGEKFAITETPSINIEVEGTGKIANAEVFVDGKSEKVFRGANAKEKFVFTPENLEAGQHIFYTRITQADGNRAWSSPMWIDFQPPNKTQSQTPVSSKAVK
jgi:hypothetical protein